MSCHPCKWIGRKVRQSRWTVRTKAHGLCGYVASGRTLMQIEQFMLEEVLPYYANSHTEASYCGGMMTRLRREARAVIANCCGADERHA